MMGLGSSAQITPRSSGIILVILSGDIVNSNNNSESQIQLRYGITPAPGILDGDSGLSAGGAVRLQTGGPATVNIANPFTLNAIINNLNTDGSTYWIDIAHRTTGGTSTISNLSISIIEL
jgi:hypothetical protein